MKILGIEVEGMPLFEKKLFVNFMPVQRVSDENSKKMYELFECKSQHYWKNNIVSFIGINASGKTTILNLITFIFHMINSETLHTIKERDIFENLEEDKCVEIRTYFYSDKNIQMKFNKIGVINCLYTAIIKENGKLRIKTEYLKAKSVTKVTKKESIFDFTNEEICLSRGIGSDFLLDDVSIMVAFNKKNDECLCFTDMLQYTNNNQLNIDKDCPIELIKFLDPSIEYLKIDNTKINNEIKLKFIGKSELVLSKIEELNRYLSSGTIKGINTYLKAFETFKNGGYLIIDEIENHFNHEIVSTLLRFYMDQKVNQKGATLILSTHLAEILDEFDRNDNIYIVRNNSGISAENLSNMLTRNDSKRSECYKSGYFVGTTPNYDSYIELKKLFVASIRGANDGIN